MPQHLDYGRLKALSIRLRASIHLEGKPLAQPDDDQVRKHGNVLSDAWTNGEVARDRPGRLDDVLSGTPTLLGTVPEGSHPETVGRRDAFIRELAEFRCCDRIADGSRGCTGNASTDWPVIAAGGPCLRPLTDLFKSLERSARRLYGLGAETEPRVFFSTAPEHDAVNTGVLGKYGVAGYHDPDGPSGKDSIVTLVVKDSHFDWESLCATYYTLAHELVCHAFQCSGGMERENASKTCPLTECWMDVLALRMSKHWLRANVGSMPAWISLHPDQVNEISDTIHKERRAAGTYFKTGQAARLKDAAWALSQLGAAWKETGTAEDSRLTRFLLRLNRAHLTPDARNRLGLQLTVLLHEPGTKAMELAVGACAEFEAGQDIAGFVSEIERIAAGQPIAGRQP